MADAPTVSSLKDHLFAQLNRLSNPALTAEQVTTEVARTEAIVSISDQLVEGYKVQLAAARLYADHGAQILPHLPQIGKS
jgi:hypothetical protein